MEAFKEFCTVVLGHRLTVYIDHKKLIFESFTTKIVLCWHLMSEEYGPVIKYIEGPDNDAADTLCRLPLSKSDVEESEITK